MAKYNTTTGSAKKTISHRSNVGNLKDIHEIVPLVGAIIGIERVKFLEAMFPNPPQHANVPVWPQMLFMMYMAHGQDMDSLATAIHKLGKQKSNKPHGGVVKSKKTKNLKSKGLK